MQDGLRVGARGQGTFCYRIAREREVFDEKGWLAVVTSIRVEGEV